MKNMEVWRFVRDKLAAGSAVMLLAVVESRGASPGKAGFKLAVASDGSRSGTIGGGVMELNWVEESRSKLGEGKVSGKARTLFHSRRADREQSGLICSGSQTIVRKLLTGEDLVAVERILRAFANRQYGRLRLTPTEFSFTAGERGNTDNNFSLLAEHAWLYEENAGVLDTVYVVGSGHVGLALCRVLATLDFRVVVIDERENVETFTTNVFAHDRIHAPYEALETLVAGNGREYAAVVTTAYISDERALRILLKKNMPYIGMMGSAAKTKQIFDDLKAEGAAHDDLQRIRTPIGLPINSHTPEEIAVSIAAEIIHVRNSRNS